MDTTRSAVVKVKIVVKPRTMKAADRQRLNEQLTKQRDALKAFLEAAKREDSNRGRR